MSRLHILLAVVALLGCESNLISNEPLPHVDARDGGKRDAKASSSSDAGVVVVDEEPTDDDVEPADDNEPSGGEQVEVDASAPEGDASTSESDAGEQPVPTASKIKGSGVANKCTSYGTPKNGMCAGYYCGVTVDDVTAELKMGGKCSSTPEEVCEGQLTRDVAKCARDTKSNPANVLDSDEQIRAKVATCVTKIAANADIEEDCLGCFLDAAQCASDNCLTQCLTGDSAGCDKCRMDNNCNQTVPTCAGLPSPF